MDRDELRSAELQALWARSLAQQELIIALRAVMTDYGWRSTEKYERALEAAETKHMAAILAAVRHVEPGQDREAVRAIVAVQS